MDKIHWCISVWSVLSESGPKSAMPRLSSEERWRSFGMRDSRMLPVEIAAHFGCTRQSILALFRRHGASGSVDDGHRSGRPRVTTQRQDRMILLNHLRDRWMTETRTVREIVGSHGRTISSSTVRRRLASQSLPICRPNPVTTEQDS